jgi:hypothetical protein
MPIRAPSAGHHLASKRKRKRLDRRTWSLRAARPGWQVKATSILATHDASLAVERQPDVPAVRRTLELGQPLPVGRAPRDAVAGSPRAEPARTLIRDRIGSPFGPQLLSGQTQHECIVWLGGLWQAARLLFTRWSDIPRSVHTFIPSTRPVSTDRFEQSAAIRNAASASQIASQPDAPFVRAASHAASQARAASRADGLELRRASACVRYRSDWRSRTRTCAMGETPVLGRRIG